MRPTTCGHSPYYAKGLCGACYNRAWQQEARTVGRGSVKLYLTLTERRKVHALAQAAGVPLATWIRRRLLLEDGS